MDKTLDLYQAGIDIARGMPRSRALKKHGVEFVSDDMVESAVKAVRMLVDSGQLTLPRRWKRRRKQSRRVGTDKGNA